MLKHSMLLAALCFAGACQGSPRAISPGDPVASLRLEHRVPLPNVAGRIDHLAIDLAHQRLFVAEYGNGSVDIVDLVGKRPAGRITGLHEPQGVAVLADGQIVVACGDGSVHFYTGEGMHEVAALTLGDDADNVRVDARNGHVVIGFGTGALAVIDPRTHQLLSTLELAGHPEGFRMTGGNVLVNIPDRGTIVAANIDTGVVRGSWSTGMHRMNFPLAIDPGGRWLALAYRFPAALQVRDVVTGEVLSTRSACGDADDLFIDGNRFLLICGAGNVDISSTTDASARPIRVTTAPGARTGLFVAERSTLYLAVPARGSTAAAIWILRTR